MPTRIDRRLKCRGCPLDGAEHVDHKVQTHQYGKKPDLFIIAEAPGKDENREGEPMVGSAGRILWRLLDDVGIKKAYIGNILRCRPPSNRDPEPEEIRHCIQHLYQDLYELRPKAVLLTGKIPGNALLKTNKSAAKMRGWNSITVKGRSFDTYVTNHPSALHYDPDKKSTIESDLIRVRRRLRGEEDIELDYRWRYVDTLRKLDLAIEDTLRQSRSIGFDWEALDLRLINVTPLTLAWGWRIRKKGQKPWYRVYSVPLRHRRSPFGPRDFPKVVLKLQRMWRKLRSLHFQGVVELNAHNARFDCCLHRDVLNVNLPRVFCTMQGAHAIDENRLKGGGGEGIFSLEALAIDWLGMTPEFWDERTSDLLYSGQGDKTNCRKLADHCAKDVAVGVALRHEITRRARSQDYMDSLDRLTPLLEGTQYLLGHIEQNGIPVDMNMLSQLRSDKGPLLARQKQIHEEIHDLPSVQETIKKVRGGEKASFAFTTGKRRGFQIRKRAYLQTLFFDVLNIPWGAIREQQTKTGLAKIDKDFFGTFQDGIEEVALIGEWRALDKLINTYIEGWWNFVKDSPDGRIRASFNPAGTTTGRLSSSKPNLQQIPKGKTPAAKILKKIFRPHCVPGSDDLRVIVACDLSQAEVRWLAEISGEVALRDMYVRRASMLEEYSRKPSERLMQRIKLECDLHTSTAAEMFGIPIADVTSNERAGAKSITFGNIYGQTVFGLAAQLGISVEEAEELLDRWLGRFKYASQWFEYTEKFAKEHGFVESPLGRRRHLDALLLGMNIHEGSALSHLLRVSRNAPIQSVASDMNLWIAIKVQEHIDRQKKPWKLLALVHDSVIAEVPIWDVLEYVDFTKGIAESPRLLSEFDVPIMKVPHEMEFEVGFSYGETKELTTSKREQEQVVQGIWDEWKAAA
jgi:uracil-DNA glycosylase family 4